MKTSTTSSKSESVPTGEQLREWNEKRCLAHQIILDLFEAKQTSQIQLLSMATALSHKQLDPAGYKKFIQHSLSTMESTPTPKEKE